MDAQVQVVEDATGAGEREKFVIENEISAATVDPVVKALLDPEAEEGRLIELHLRHNSGGNVDKMHELIQALLSTTARVEITYSRYVMSAAATIWLLFLVAATERVQSLLPKKPGVVMYHRPRRMQGEYLCFADEIETAHPLKDALDRKFAIFDRLFTAVMDALRQTGPDGSRRAVPDEHIVFEEDGLRYRHYLWRLEEAYYRNQDCLIPV